MNLLARILLEIFRFPILGLWHLRGWGISQPLPDVPKMVLTAAPHTSNWDYLHALLAAYQLRRRLNVTMKDTLFKPPFGWLLRLLGAIPIDRSKSHNVVFEVAQKVKEADRMAMIFTPSGTRSYTEYWKTGFYWTALKANVPIVCVAINYETRTVNLGLVFEPSGDIEADFEMIRAYQEEYGAGLYPEKVSKIAINPRRKVMPMPADESTATEASATEQSKVS